MEIGMGAAGGGSCNVTVSAIGASRWLSDRLTTVAGSQCELRGRWLRSKPGPRMDRTCSRVVAREVAQMTCAAGSSTTSKFTCESDE
jgi:hypothetical protein